MSTYQRALDLAAKLEAAGLSATCDPRSATPPCVVLAPPPLRFDTGCGATATWGLWLLAPGPANADAWVTLDDMLAAVVGVVDVELVDFANYAVTVDAAPVPAYRAQFTESVDT